WALLMRRLPLREWVARGRDSLLVRQLFLGLTVFLSPIPVLLLIFLPYRFMLPYSVLIILMLAMGMAYLIEHSRPPRGWVAATLVVGLFSLTSLFPMYQSISLDRILEARHYLRDVRAAGLWLAEHGDIRTGTAIVTHEKPLVVSFFASGKRDPITVYTWPEDLSTDETLCPQIDEGYLVLFGPGATIPLPDCVDLVLIQEAEGSAYRIYELSYRP
ncbi:MAG: hypothetical protein ACLFTK_14435, partial [Anaerolineales bacterium]